MVMEITSKKECPQSVTIQDLTHYLLLLQSLTGTATVAADKSQSLVVAV